MSWRTWIDNGWTLSANNNHVAARKIKASWWVDLTFAGTRYRKRSPENSRAGALAYEATLRQRLARGERLDQLAADARKTESFGQFAEKWFNEYVVSNNKYSEQKTKKYILRSSLLPFFGNMPIEQIKAQQIEQYKAHVLKTGASRKTVNNRLTVFRKCLTTAYEWLHLEGSPPKIVWLKCPPSKTDYLTSDECDRLLANATGIVYELILTGLRTGMRQGELKGLQWSSIDWSNRSLVVRHSRSDYTKSLDAPKNNRERHIPLDNAVHDVLLKRKSTAGYVFLDVDKKPFDNNRLNRRLANVCEKAGLRKIGWHVLRHTFASHLVMKGAPLAAVQMLLGHSTITMTMKYAHLAPSTLRSAIDLLDPKMTATSGQPVGNQWLDLQWREAA